MTDARTINTYDRGSLIETHSSEREIQQVLVPRRYKAHTASHEIILLTEF